MEKKNNILIILIIILSVLVGGLGSFIVYDKVLNKDTNVGDTTNENKVEENTTNENDNISKEDNYYGTYTVKYYENTNEDIKANKESSLTLNTDNTFVFNYNACAGMIDVKGKYEIKDNKIILSNLTSGYQDVLDGNLNGHTNLEFIIVSENEIYLNFEYDFACTIAGNKAGSFVKE